MFLVLLRHEWKHGLAPYIGGDNGDEIAEFVNRILSEKCGVSIDMKAAKNGMKQDAARALNFPVLLHARYVWHGIFSSTHAVFFGMINIRITRDARRTSN